MEQGKIPVKPLCGKSDWSLWKYRIKFVLNHYADALEVVEGKLQMPDQPEHIATEGVQKAYRDEVKAFNKANNSAMMVLTNAMTEDTLQKVMRFILARDVWLELHKIFEDSSDNQLYNICLQFFKFSWSNDDMAAHLSKLKNLWNDLNSGLEIKNENRLPEMLLICKILDTLPSSYRTFKSSWLLLSDEKRTLDELTTQLCTHERELKKESSHSENLDQEALAANSEVRKKTPYRKKNNNRCNYCQLKGHWIRTCKKWIADGKPPKPNHLNGGSYKNNSAVNMTLLAVNDEIFSAETNTDEWFIDNGASKHVTNNSHYFVDFEKFELPHSITVANGKSLSAIGKGTIEFMTFVNGKSQVIKLGDVWYVPEISKNLFSVLATQDKHQNSVFESTFKECNLSINGEIFLNGSRSFGGGLFKAAMTVIAPKIQVDVNMTVSDDAILQLYHERWGHQDKQHIKSVIEKEFNLKVKPDKNLCEACVYGKAHRLKFGTRKKATKAGELISTDICGPFEESFRKFRYFAIFKDDYTKFRYCFFLKHKSEIKDVLEDFIIHAKNLGHNIQNLLSDNGGEFDNHAVQKILKKYGISQRLTAPYTPEQNGSCERDNRTIVEMARTLKYSNEQVSFPAYLWAEFISTSIYILNRTGKSSVPGSSPYELWMGKKPRIKHMRIIGTTCYAHIPVQKRRKMDKKAIKGYLVGYDQDERYRIYIQKTGTVICSRDVIFEEKPFKSENAVILPPEQDCERNLCQDDKSVVDVDEESEEKIDDIQQKITRPKRQRSAPKWTEDYVMEGSEIYKEIFPEVNEIMNKGESNRQLKKAKYNDPESVEEALTSPDAEKWKLAMEEELENLRRNETWDIVPRPKDRRIVKCKWIFKRKLDKNGEIERYKARLVARGYTQVEGIDYKETFSPVIKSKSIRTLLAFAVEQDWQVHQLDVTAAYLNGRLNETVFMEQPPLNFCDKTDEVCLLKRSLYGLHQSGREWNKCLDEFLKSIGLTRSRADPCVYFDKKRELIIGVYVDDLLILSKQNATIQKFKDDISAVFKIKDLGEINYLLSIRIDRNKEGSITLDQSTYANELLETTGMSNAKGASTPLDPGMKYVPASEENKLNPEEALKYRQAVGGLLYLAGGTRPDLAFATTYMSQFSNCPSKEHWSGIQHILRYLKQTKDLKLTFQKTGKSIEVFCDSDWAGDKIDRRSFSGYIVLLAGGAISWSSKKQRTTALSTVEAEYLSMCNAAKEVLWFQNFLQEVAGGHFLNLPQNIFVDNQGAISLAKNHVTSERNKHIELRHFFLREKIEEKLLTFTYVPSASNVADMLTKSVQKKSLYNQRDGVGLREI